MENAATIQSFTRTSTDADGFLAKLVKYVPVEGLAPFLPLAATAGDAVVRLWITFIVALIVGVVLIAVQVKKSKKRSRGWFWPFVVIAFAAWTVGASEAFRDMLNVSEEAGGWFLGLTAAALPLLDSGLETLMPAKTKQSAVESPPPASAS